MNSKLIVEVSASAARTTIALAAAARQTGGLLTCILSDDSTLDEAMLAMKELNLSEVEFISGDAKGILSQYSDAAFALVDCKEDDYIGIMNRINLNPSSAVVVVDNLMDKKASAAYGNFVKKRVGASSIFLALGKVIEVIRFSGAQQTRHPFKDTGAGSCQATEEEGVRQV